MGRAWHRRFGAPAVTHSFDLPDAVPESQAVIAGYGRTGRAAAGGLLSAGIPVLVVESNHRVYEETAGEAIPAIWGDITGHEIMHAAHVETARVLMLTVPDPAVVHLAAQRAKEINPDILIVARATRPDHVAELKNIGVTAVIQPEFEGGIEMVRRALTQFRDDPSAIADLLSDVRDSFYDGAPALKPPVNPR
jgi:CPA2 family monovalent cation:H+ antiporter-2